MRKTATRKPSTDAQLASIAEETEAFLKAEYKASDKPDEVLGLEPNTRGKLATSVQQQK